MEGSATAADLTEPVEGSLVHTNHYVCESMLAYEGDPEYAEASAVRFRRAGRLIAEASDGSVQTDRMRSWLSDHEGAPDSICRHEHQGSQTVTCFWCVADVTNGEITYGRGNPCDSVAQNYTFDDYGPR